MFNESINDKEAMSPHGEAAQEAIAHQNALNSEDALASAIAQTAEKMNEAVTKDNAHITGKVHELPLTHEQSMPNTLKAGCDPKVSDKMKETDGLYQNTSEEGKPLDILHLMLDLYEQSSEFQFDEQNFMEGMALAEKFVTEKEVDEYIRKDPDDPIGKFGKLLMLYQVTRPLHEWDVQKMMDLSNVTAPFLEGLQEDMPNMKAKAEIDELTGTCATVTITLPRDEEILLWGKLYEKFQKVIQVTDGFNVFVKANGEISLSFDFKDVKKPIPQNQ